MFLDGPTAALYWLGALAADASSTAGAAGVAGT